jgi:hypothetical protein
MDMKAARSIVTTIAFATTIVGSIAAQGSNPRIGKWKLKQDAPPPAQNIMTYEAAGAGMKVTVDSVNSASEKTHWTYTTMLDGKDAPITGYATADTAAVTRVDARTNEIVYKKNGKVAQTATNVISADGRTVTVTFHRTNAQGEPVTTVAVYEKQP